MKVKVLDDNQQWDNFLKIQKFSPFVQASSYGDFFRSMGESVWIFGIYSEDKLIGGSLVVSTHAKRGNFLYLPYGPILPVKQKECAAKILFDKIAQLAKSEGYIFVRCSPFTDETQENKNLYKKLGFRSAPMHVLAETTWLLDISKSEEGILANMRKNHRNLIRRCERESVKIEFTTDTRKLKQFNILFDKTAKRHHFHRFSKKYVEEEFKAFAKSNQVALVNAYLPDGTLDAAAIIMFYGNMAAYRHSASLNTNKKLPTSYLIQWEVIKEAKRRGLLWYNLWGIAPLGANKSHPFFGITHFKRGFGGQQKNLLHCQDMPLSGKYWLNWVVENIRRIKRGF